MIENHIITGSQNSPSWNSETHKDHWAQLLAPHRTTLNSNRVSKLSLCSGSSGLCPLPWAAASMPTTLWCTDILYVWIWNRTFQQRSPDLKRFRNCSYPMLGGITTTDHLDQCKMTTNDQIFLQLGCVTFAVIYSDLFHFDSDKSDQQRATFF